MKAPSLVTMARHRIHLYRLTEPYETIVKFSSMLFQPNEFQSKNDCSTSIPPYFQRHKVNRALCTYLTYNNAGILSQVLSGHDYQIGIYHLAVKDSMSIDLLPQLSKIRMTICLQGVFIFKGDPGYECEMREKECSMAYLNMTGHHSVFLKPGNYTLCHIDYQPAHLSPYVQHAGILQQMVQMAEVNHNETSSYYTAELSKSILDKIWLLFRQDDRDILDQLIYENSTVDEVLKTYVKAAPELLSGNGKAHKGTNGILLRIRDYIVANATEKLTIPYLAEKFGLSIDHLKRDFKYQFGIPVHDFHLHERIKYSIEMMDDANLSISQIAIQCGFHDTAHYTKSFKSIMGQTPSDYRAGITKVRSLKRP